MARQVVAVARQVVAVARQVVAVARQAVVALLVAVARQVVAVPRQAAVALLVPAVRRVAEVRQVAVALLVAVHCHRQRIMIRILPIGTHIVWVVILTMGILLSQHVQVVDMMVQVFFMKMVVAMVGMTDRDGLGGFNQYISMKLNLSHLVIKVIVK